MTKIRELTPTSPAVQEYLDFLADSHRKDSIHVFKSLGWDGKKNADTYEEFIQSTKFVVESGHKYFKVVEVTGHGRRVHSFIVPKELIQSTRFTIAKWAAGTILKAEGWKRPALNFSRGNVLVPASYATSITHLGV
jgi:hypothetical protein